MRWFHKKEASKPERTEEITENECHEESVKATDLASVEKNIGEQFYVFRNMRLYDADNRQMASVEEPIFLSRDVTGKTDREIWALNDEMAEKHAFSPSILAKEEGRLYAVFQFFDNEKDAYAYLEENARLLYDKTLEGVMGIYEHIEDGKEVEVETKDGVVKMKGRLVDNYYLKRTIRRVSPERPEFFEDEIENMRSKILEEMRLLGCEDHSLLKEETALNALRRKRDAKDVAFAIVQ